MRCVSRTLTACVRACAQLGSRRSVPVNRKLSSRVTNEISDRDSDSSDDDDDSNDDKHAVAAPVITQVASKKRGRPRKARTQNADDDNAAVGDKTASVATTSTIAHTPAATAIKTTVTMTADAPVATATATVSASRMSTAHADKKRRLTRFARDASGRVVLPASNGDLTLLALGKVRGRVFVCACMMYCEC
jgi:hypothetical protein